MIREAPTRGLGIFKSKGGNVIVATGTSLFLIATGAILAFAVNYSVSGIDIKVVGAILMVVGAVGLFFSLLFLESIRNRTPPYHEVTSHDRSEHHHDPV